MNRIHRLRRCTRLALLGLSATLLAGHATAAFKVVGYFPSWQGDVDGIPYNKANEGLPDVDAWSTADGANVHQWACHGDANRRFRLVRK